MLSAGFLLLSLPACGGSDASVDAGPILDVTPSEMKKRMKSWKKPEPRYTRGVLAKYASTVSSASEGAVTDKNLNL